MTDATRAELERERRIWLVLGRVLLVVAVVALTLALVDSNRKADRVSCIDDLEVSWRISVGQGVSELIRNETDGLERSADELDVTTERLEEVEAGRRCRYEPPFPL